MEEIWKDITGSEGYYRVSSLGRIYSVRRDKILSPGKSRGYLAVNIKLNNIRKSRSVHRIVAMEFIPNVESKPDINHKDLNKENNCIDNLEWVTKRENIRHAISNGVKILGRDGNKRHCGNNQHLVDNVCELHESIVGEKINYLFNKIN